MLPEAQREAVLPEGNTILLHVPTSKLLGAELGYGTITEVIVNSLFIVIIYL